MKQFDVKLNDGRTLHAYDTALAGARLTVIWHHGTPNIGSPPEPLLGRSAELGVRWVSFDRPGYGGSSALPGRSVGSVAADVAQLADALTLEDFGVMGHSGGGPHALACGVLLPGQVTGVVSIAGLAPYGADGLDWFAGMRPGGIAGLQAARRGLEAKEAYEYSDPPFDPEMFLPADYAALAGPWKWLDSVVGPAQAAGPQGLIADDLAYVHPWEADPAALQAPLLLLHGQLDRVVPSSHSEWLARHSRAAELRLFPEDGHLSVLNQAQTALEWLVEVSEGK